MTPFRPGFILTLSPGPRTVLREAILLIAILVGCLIAGGAAVAIAFLLLPG